MLQINAKITPDFYRFNNPAINSLSFKANGQITDKTVRLKENMNHVLENIKIGGTFLDHNSALDVVSLAKKRGIIQKPLTLLHFDTHSDLRIMPNDIKTSNGEGIADWVTKGLNDGSFDKIYWVLPEWTKDKDNYETFWNNSAQEAVFLDQPDNRLLYVKNNCVYSKKPQDYEQNKGKYRTVELKKITVNELPNLKNNNDIMLDIDGDYFVNSGHDTANGATNDIGTPEEVKQKINESYFKLFDELKKKEIKPIIYTGAESTNYVPSTQLNYVAHLLQKVLKKSRNGTIQNEFLNPMHNYDNNRNNAMAFPKNNYTLLAKDHYFGDLLQKLQYLETASPYNLVNDANDKTLNRAVWITAKHFKTDYETGGKMLVFLQKKLAPKSGSTYDMIKTLAATDYVNMFKQEFNLKQPEKPKYA